ncbi:MULTISPECIES: L,D-transpeptidase [unclassified Microcoleus]|uniref:L,D-transpeptidase n=1 Tax=unclassified Microcoleus TaxID=2642155 RepID=UPI001D8C9BA6|nr:MULTISPECIES: L,D-transpeptidase [unclassified Microcoleus]MCC3410580.1 L,D-transpeptidase [Microcoleus sp. PH2017_02_FOX_O_A]MCC3489231.1 L,D-transpeptidase [Microcoleus sp. PH2017_16_JOR_D_A]MCC3515959.1 L,D-transpeptidase [Microcoleus sp. PH2017_18_LLB_O_A]MCC3533990.1 L,D-transpeptidase [Microcoleus sp. PH2017_25_DOB_D_A]MCC3546066.1 L,D-transpeptidase [Microcoleus sp. PH2017_24_DOB_U_A]
MKRHSLAFTMSLAASNDLIYGSLKLTYPDKGYIEYSATSGCTQWQQPGDEWARGKGPIPSGFEYQIPTVPYWLPTRGIEGFFFHITPDPVSESGHVRSELGIHFDANVPGSAGCIVLKNFPGWQRFCDRMGAIAKSGIKSIPLSVNYN